MQRYDERMHPNDHHLIEKHKVLLPTFEHEKDVESNIMSGDYLIAHS